MEQKNFSYFISRHQGAIEWARRNEIAFDHHLTHLTDVGEIRAGDLVIGTLPVNIVAELCSRGARYLHLTLNVPSSLRGQELSAEQLLKLNARLTEYSVR